MVHGNRGEECREELPTTCERFDDVWLERWRSVVSCRVARGCSEGGKAEILELLHVDGRRSSVCAEWVPGVGEGARSEKGERSSKLVDLR